MTRQYRMNPRCRRRTYRTIRLSKRSTMDGGLFNFRGRNSTNFRIWITPIWVTNSSWKNRLQTYDRRKTMIDIQPTMDDNQVMDFIFERVLWFWRELSPTSSIVSAKLCRAAASTNSPVHPDFGTKCCCTRKSLALLVPCSDGISSFQLPRTTICTKKPTPAKHGTPTVSPNTVTVSTISSATTIRKTLRLKTVPQWCSPVHIIDWLTERQSPITATSWVKFP